MNNEIIKKVQKLLSLAQSDNENEAKMASAKAQEILLKYNLDLQQVVDAAVEYGEEGVGNSSKLTMEAKEILPLIMDAFRVRCIVLEEWERSMKGRLRRMRKPTFVGEKTNLQIAVYTYQFLMRSYKDQFRTHQKATKCSSKMRYSFYRGLSSGLRYQFKIVKDKVETERGLVLKRDPKLDEFFANLFPKTKQIRTDVKDIDPSTYQHGKEAGQKLRIHRGIENSATNSGRTLTGKS
jgi:hypothetical protein